MIIIILSTCLISDPGVCRDQEIPLDSEMSPMRCAMSAPPHVAQWNEEHPQWRVLRWQCRTNGKRDI